MLPGHLVLLLCLATGGHDLVIRAECLVLVRAEVDLLAVDLDVPAVAGSAVERFREVRHGDALLFA